MLLVWGASVFFYFWLRSGLNQLELNSEWVIQVNIAIMRVFVRLREFFINYTELSRRLVEFKRRMVHKDEEIKAIFEAIKQLMISKQKPHRVIKTFSG